MCTGILGFIKAFFYTVQKYVLFGILLGSLIGVGYLPMFSELEMVCFWDGFSGCFLAKGLVPSRYFLTCFFAVSRVVIGFPWLGDTLPPRHSPL